MRRGKQILHDYARKLSFRGNDPAITSQRRPLVQLPLPTGTTLPLRHSSGKSPVAAVEALLTSWFSLHRLSPTEKEWLSSARLFFNDTLAITFNPSGHHKHGQYIILHSPMPGFFLRRAVDYFQSCTLSPQKVCLLEHFHYAVLSKGQKRGDRLFSALLRSLSHPAGETPARAAYAYIEVSW